MKMGVFLSLAWLAAVYGDGFSTLEEEYTSTYCLQLEAAYGEGLMSEGGKEGIDRMFDAIALTGRVALDIGSGLGGVAFYMAGEHDMNVTGLEVNKWMIEEARRRVPSHLDGRVDFILSTSNSHFDLPSQNFDIVYSKGVLTHVRVKDGLFQECHRILKDDGLLVIVDWLSSDKKVWGENIQNLVELEHLALFPESEAGYIDLLEKSGFTLLSIRDDSALYRRFNQEIILRLESKERLGDYAARFSDKEIQASIDGYASIVKALDTGELRVLRFIAKKRS